MGRVGACNKQCHVPQTPHYQPGNMCSFSWPNTFKHPPPPDDGNEKLKKMGASTQTRKRTSKRTSFLLENVESCSLQKNKNTQSQGKKMRKTSFESAAAETHTSRKPQALTGFPNCWDAVSGTRDTDGQGQGSAQGAAGEAPSRPP